MNRTRRDILLWILSVVVAVGAVLPGRVSAQCDPNSTWTVYKPTGEISEIVMQGNRAWVAAIGGVIRADLGVGVEQQVKIADVDGLVSTAITCMTADVFGNIWVGTREDGVSVLNPDGVHLDDLSSFDELHSDRVVAMGSRGNRVVVVSVDEFSSSGAPEGGGFVIITVESDGSGGFTYTPRFGGDLEVGQDVLVRDQDIWFGTSGQGVWVRDETQDPVVLRQELTQTDGLLSANVKKIVEAPHHDLSGRNVLWIGTGRGLQTYDPATEVLETVPGFGTQNILDLFVQDSKMYAITEVGAVRDVWVLDLTKPLFGFRVPRAPCLGDTTAYVPRDIGVDMAGHLVLGTLQQGFAVSDSLSKPWSCPPSLGPHAPQIADLHFASTGILYFGTGDDDRLNTNWDGVGVFDGENWTSITRPLILHGNMTQVHEWVDGTIWFGSTQDQTFGGLNRYFPDTGAIENYHNQVSNPSRRTQGRQVRSIKEDALGNLWIAYSQADPSGGLSVIERPPSLAIKNYDWSLIFGSTTPLLRDFAFDSRGRIWITTGSVVERPGQLYVIDTKGTLFDLTDDTTVAFNLANQIFELGEVKDIEIDSADRIWLAGQEGLAIGQIDPGGGMFASWSKVVPNATQAGGRNPLPYNVAVLDAEENLWLGTESAGIVRISNDRSVWTWFDQLEGCPLPDQAVTGIHFQANSDVVWIGTGTGGIARVDLSGTRAAPGADAIDAQPYPNPWDPNRDLPLAFRGLPSDSNVDLRIYTAAGELVHEQLDARAPIWAGETLSGSVVESGVYIVRATEKASGSVVFQAKVAVLR